MMEVDEAAVARVAEETGALALYLHGSMVAGSPRADSDLDVAILLPRDSQESLGHIGERLASALDLPVDRVDVQDLRIAPPLFRRRVVTEGQLVHVSATTALAAFQARSLCESWDTEIFLRPIRRAMKLRIREGRFAA